jgi:Ser/Thr protein kinase RdoA (MazF antagonist)
MMTLAPNPHCVGSIHADLHLSNLVVNRGRVYPIDFESYGWGYYAFDIASPLFEMVPQPNGTTLRQALLDGYTSVRPLPVAHEQQIDRFIMARAFGFVNWILTAANDAVRRRYQHSIPQTIDLMQTLAAP